jgi:hypothetical protein
VIGVSRKVALGEKYSGSDHVAIIEALDKTELSFGVVTLHVGKGRIA